MQHDHKYRKTVGVLIGWSTEESPEGTSARQAAFHHALAATHAASVSLLPTSCRTDATATRLATRCRYPRFPLSPPPPLPLCHPPPLPLFPSPPLSPFPPPLPHRADLSFELSLWVRRLHGRFFSAHRTIRVSLSTLSCFLPTVMCPFSNCPHHPPLAPSNSCGTTVTPRRFRPFVRT